ncbi:MAG TPA: 2-amino-4-hydroxy-6-hydroxymethyldihydropteridine diphosphokinase [Rhodanobacteraceae bacterium]|nr:2-amino-4-hydroxy-6-hydroxymethyldihydropteridine diphosphokinase [Rhodanobacteraceae bacterium]
MTIAFVALGSNLDDPRAQVLRGFESLSRLPETKLLARSRLYRSAPWGVVEQPEFVNAVAEMETSLAPRALLEALLGIERAAGRDRSGAHWGPRVLDLDLLLYDDIVLDEPGLSLPHPHLHERIFVLLPLADLVPDFEVPGRGRVRELLARVDAAGCTLLA